ncbi:MAG: alanine--tRNA ligase [Gammaproteobacteria bacterium]|nr:MAG: alanine--tRNA ligase [Gammaproteobacteria bacterium]
MKTGDIRNLFLAYFEDKGHKIVGSDTLVPSNDPTLLFTNAGMVPFKDVFLGREKRDYKRAASSQRCVRAGGKHNDLENVGYTARHHTFFEMLGNFSFGDYFKHDAIPFAWEFLTEVAGLPEEKLWVTVYQDDDEAADIWLNEVGVSPDRFTRIGDKPGGKQYESDNFWAMGDTGPCGPCTEIFYDHGESVAGGPPGTPEEDGDRYIEIWNIVFMQYNRDEAGMLHDLPRPSVDTGMGLERLAAVLQGVHENYEIDLFQTLIKSTANVTGVDFDIHNKSLRVIADHIRSCAFLIVDGVQPSNEGRGYVLRRIIRRAIRHGHQLGTHDIFFYKLVEPLCQEMGEAFPELVQAKATVEAALKQEEERFAETLDQGIKILEQDLADLSGDQIPGETIFRLYDTFGFPVDLTADIAREKGLGMDMDGFEKYMEEQRGRARSAGAFKADYSASISSDITTDFIGYDHLSGASGVLALMHEGQSVDRIEAGQSGAVVAKTSPFYAESGGQVGDHGTLINGRAEFRVEDTQKQGSNAIVHFGTLVKGDISVGDQLQLHVDEAQRQATALNHSATHLLHAALRQILGKHVTQKGSLVDAERLRFDFSHSMPLTEIEIDKIETLVNEHIRMNHPVETRLMNIQQAMNSGAMALFGEKYDDEVRVLSMGDFSVELCGGTHVQRTGDIGLLKVTMETGIAAGIRRIEAVTGQHALDYIHQSELALGNVASLVKGSRQDTVHKVRQMADRLRVLEKELEQLKGVLASSQGDDLADQAIDVQGVKVLAHILENADAKRLRETVDQLKNKLGTAAVVLGSVDGDKVRLVAGVTKEASKKIPAGDLVNAVAQQVGGRGGGRPDMAQAGGSDTEALPGAMQSVAKWVEERLA